MRGIHRWLLFLYFATLGTYAIPELRLPGALGGLPYGVVLIGLTWLAVLWESMFGVEKLTGKSQSALYAVLCYSLGALLSIVGAHDIDYLLVFKMCVFPTIILLVALVQPDLRGLTRLLLVLGVTGILLAGYGLYGFVTGATGAIEEHLLGYFGITYTEATRNGDILYIIVPFWCLAGLLWSRYGVASARWGRVTLWCLLGCLSLALLMSFVRGIWITIPLTCIFGGVLIRKPGKRFAAAAAIAIALLAITQLGGIIGQLATAWGGSAQQLVARAQTVGTLESSAQASNRNENRLVLIRAAVKIGVESSPFGLGIGQFRNVAPEEAELVVNHAENMYLQVFCEQGWLSLAGLLWICSLTIAPVVDENAPPGIRFVTGTCRLIGLNLLLYALMNLMIDGLWFWSVEAVCISVNSAAGTPALAPAAKETHA